VAQRLLLENVSFAIGWGERVVAVGPNGSGKTTLLRALQGEQGVAAGRVTVSPSTRLGYLPQTEPADDERSDRNPVQLVRAEVNLSETETRRFLHRFLFSGDEALRPLSQLSYGERRRLALARLVLGGANLLVLDEPTNHLDIPSREAFEAALDAFEGAILAVTHDRYFIKRFGHRVLAIEDRRLREL
jgi:ATP-binding cassette subfamily F protein 3